MSERLSPVRAIRRYCVDFCAMGRKAARECILDCPLHEYRMGTNPRRAGIAGNGPLNFGFPTRQPGSGQADAETATGTTESPHLTDDQLIDVIAKRLRGEAS